jgi:predicted MFS family arabinose efflux permease
MRSHPFSAPKAMHSPKQILIAVCAAQLFAQMGAYTLPALLPTFMREWALSNTEAGWLTGVFYAAYVAAVPVLVTWTDRIDAKKIYVGSVFATMLSHLGFIFLADGFASGMVFRIIAGIGWAGTYMPGLKVLADTLEGKMQTRAVSFHAASVGVAGSSSFLIAATVEQASDWHWAFACSAAFSAIAFLLAVIYMPRRAHTPPSPAGGFFDFRPVLRNYSSLAYSLGYFAHTWEMFVQRNWVIVLLVYVAADIGLENPPITPALVPFIGGLLGTWASVTGNELALRTGRQRWVLGVFLASMTALTAVALLASSGLYMVIVAICLVHSVLIYADSSALTAGASGNAEPGRRGAQLALHSILGYGGGFLGAVVFGVVLDLAGGQSTAGWLAAFASVLVVLLIGPLAIWCLKPKDMPGDKPWHGKQAANAPDKGDTP